MVLQPLAHSARPQGPLLFSSPLRLDQGHICSQFILLRQILFPHLQALVHSLSPPPSAVTNTGWGSPGGRVGSTGRPAGAQGTKVKETPAVRC